MRKKDGQKVYTSSPAPPKKATLFPANPNGQSSSPSMSQASLLSTPLSSSSSSTSSSSSNNPAMGGQTRRQRDEEPLFLTDYVLSGKLEEKFEYSGKDTEDFLRWQKLVVSYLKMWGANGYLFTPWDREWSDNRKLNATCVYMYLVTCCKGEARDYLTDFHEADDRPEVAWKILEEEYLRKSECAVRTLLAKWNRLHMTPEENATKFLKRIEKLARKLAAIGHPPTNDEKILVIETGIPYSEYREMIGGLPLARIYMRRGGEASSLAFEEICTALREFDEKHGYEPGYFKKYSNLHQQQLEAKDEQREATSQPSVVDEVKALKAQLEKLQRSQSKKEKKFQKDGRSTRIGKCFWCGHIGHTKRECRKKARGEPRTEIGKRAEEESRHQYRADRVTLVNEKDEIPHAKGATICDNLEFIVDSGANATFVTSPEGVQNLQKTPARVKAEVADGSLLDIEGKGTMKLFDIRNETTPVTVSTGMTDSLLSVHSTCKQHNMSVLFDDEKCIFINGKLNVPAERQVAIGTVENGLYIYRPGDKSPMTELANSSDREPMQMQALKAYQNLNPELETDYFTWHRRFGHLYGMERTIDSHIGIGLPKSIEELVKPKETCLACVLGKQLRRSFTQPQREHPIYLPGEALHIDIQSYETPSLGGCNYELEIVDDATNATLGAAIKRKSDTPSVLFPTIDLLERKTGRKLKALYCDNAKEFILGDTEEECKKR